MQIRFESAPTGQRRAVTSGLVAMEQAELALELTQGVTDEGISRVLQYVSDYIATSGQHILAGETMRYGWSTIRFVPTASPTILNIEELTNPFAPGNEGFSVGASKAIAILTEQDATVHRNGIAKVAHHPHRSELALICRRLTPNPPPKVMVFDRIKANRSDDSGWFVGCGNTEHNHNDFNELSRLHLVYLTSLNALIVNYLAMPEDSRVVFDHGRVIVFAPGQQEGKADAGPTSA